MEKIKMIDDAFFSYLNDNDEKKCFNRISTVLHFFAKDKSFKIMIVECNPMKKDPFFGMRCLPDSRPALNMIKAMANNDFSLKDLIERWRHINNWEIEIDSRVFNRDLINFNPQELTAMLLHEIGHVVYSDKPAEAFFRAYKEAYIRSNTEDKAKYRALFRLYMIPLFAACGFRDWKVDSYDLREEIFADNSVKKLGYGDHLISA